MRDLHLKTAVDVVNLDIVPNVFPKCRIVNLVNNILDEAKVTEDDDEGSD